MFGLYIIGIFVTSGVIIDVEMTKGSTNSESFYMKIHPKNVTVEEGHSAKMSCLAMPDNNIIYRWKTTDSFIVYDQRRYLDRRDNRTLRFRHVDRYLDAREYYCVAKNTTTDYSMKSKSSYMNVQYMDPVLKIKLRSPKNASQIKIGGSVMLSCNVSAVPRIDNRYVTWYFNGKTCCKERTGNIFVDYSGTLHLKNLTVINSGFYHCRITHTTGQIDSVAPYIIHLYDKTNLMSQEMLKNPNLFSLFVKKGKSVTLNCPWKGKVTWYKFKRLEDTLTYLSSESQDVLRIQQMKLSDESYYVCQRYLNKTFDKQAVFRVSLAIMFDFNKTDFSPMPDKDNRIIFKHNEDAAIRYYKDFTPFFDYYGQKIPNPIPEITWKWKGKVIKPFNDMENEKFIYGNRHVYIPKISEKDEGVYEMTMTNLAGVRKLKFNVHVAIKPEFEKNTLPKEIKTMEGENFNLDCRIKKMSKFSEIYWKFNGHRIDRSVRNIKLSQNNKKLRVINAKPINTGVYQCFVKTVHYPEFSQNKIKYIVRAKLEFMDKSDKVFLEKEKPGIIPCPTKGYGTIEMTWYKLDRLSKKVLIELPAVNTKKLKDGSLKLDYVKYRNSGMYECVAFSPATNEQISRKINVTVGMRAKIVKISKNMTVEEGTKVFLHCQVTGDPKPIVLWMIKRPIYNNPTVIKIGINKDGFNLLHNGTLIIDRVSLKDYASYTCVGKNSDLIAESVVSLKVLSPGEYAKYLQGYNGAFNKGIVKTVIIVVSCAVTYLALIIGLIVLCSLRMLRNKRNRAMNDKLNGENHQLISHPPLNHYHSNGGGSSRHQGSHNNTLGHPSSSTPKQQPSSSSAAAPLLYSNQSNSAVQNFLPQPPASNIAPTTSSSNSNYYSQYLDANHNHTLPNLFYPTSSPNAISNSQHHNLISVAPPPTPLESRSTTNSASMYTRSHFSSSTNGGGGPNGGSLGMSSMERLTYPRHELQTEGFLGKGEFGDVLLARARNIQEGESQSLVVVKSLVMYPATTTNNNNGTADTQKTSQQQLNPSLLCHEFHRQLDMLARIDSDYVTRLLGICIEQDPCLLILEYCEWGDLKRFLRCHRDGSNPNMPPIGYSQKLSFCIQIATGMEAIANQNCVHKDLAARNLLITPQLKVKVTHLGLCREGYHADYYQDGDRLLPLRWMPPESVIRGEFSAPSDVWSYAVVLWEIFTTTGQSPLFSYTHEDILDTLASTYTSTPSQSLNNQSPRLITLYQSLERLDSLHPSSSPTTGDSSSLRITNLLQRCLSFDPNSRPNFTQILQDFKTFMTETKV